jgi:hypothetical protein
MGCSEESPLAFGLLIGQAEPDVTNELNSNAENLRYLDADHVQHPSGGTFAGLTLCSDSDESIGAISGVLVEPTSRRVRYFVVDRRTMLLGRRYLLAADTPAVLGDGDRKLRVLGITDDLERFDARLVQPFSDEDAITAIFARPAA